MREDEIRRLIEEVKREIGGKPVEELRELAQSYREEAERAEAISKALDELTEFGQGLEGSPVRLAVEYVRRRLNLDSEEAEDLRAEIEDMMRWSEADEQRDQD